MARPYKCPHCGGTKSIWKGYRKIADGKVRLRKCKGCDRKFKTRIRLRTVNTDVAEE